MKNFRKIILGMVIFSLSFGLLQGCGEKAEAPAASGPTTASGSTVVCEPAASGPAAAAAEVKADATVALEESKEEIPSNSTWKELSRQTIEHKANYAGFLSDTYGITVGYAGEIHYTNDGGKTWPAGENNSACRFGLDILNENVALASGNSGQNRITRDGGKTWQELTNYGLFEPNHNRYISIVDENTFWLASQKKIGRSADSGKTWQEIELPEEMAPISAITFQTADEGYVLNATGTLFATKDGGKTWSKQSIDFQKLGIKNGKLTIYSAPWACLRFTDAQNAVMALYATMDAGGSRIIILKTADGGKTWKDEFLPGSYVLTAVYLSRDAKYLTLYSINKELVVLSDTE